MHSCNQHFTFNIIFQYITYLRILSSKNNEIYYTIQNVLNQIEIDIYYMLIVNLWFTAASYRHKWSPIFRDDYNEMRIIVENDNDKEKKK